MDDRDDEVELGGKLANEVLQGEEKEGTEEDRSEAEENSDEDDGLVEKAWAEDSAIGG
jgi:hypothetical protein